jgi:hypothetical protein
MLYEGALKSAPFVFLAGPGRLLLRAQASCRVRRANSRGRLSPHGQRSQSELLDQPRADKIVQRSFAHWRRELRVKSLLLMGLPYAAEAGNQK